MATKRNAEDVQTDETTKKTKVEGDESKEDMVLETRSLIDNHEAGIIIGKAGANVSKIRTDTGAYLSILKNESQTKERILTIKGTTAKITKAFAAIIALLIDAATTRAQTNDPNATGPDNHPVKLLIHKFLAGSIIGKGGSIIKSIMADTEARVQLSTEALPGSTEKTVTFTGAPDKVEAAIKRVLDQIRDNPLRSGSSSILYVPGAALAQYGGNPYAPVQPQMYGQQQMYQPPAQQGFGAFPPTPTPMGMGAPAQSGAAAAGSKTEKIVIPTVCTGSVIGKGGSIIRDIKVQSGTFVSIADPEPTAPDDRVVSVTGTPQGIQTAIFLIRQRVEAYQPPGAAPAAGMPPVYQ